MLQNIEEADRIFFTLALIFTFPVISLIGQHPKRLQLIGLQKRIAAATENRLRRRSVLAGMFRFGGYGTEPASVVRARCNALVLRAWINDLAILFFPASGLVRRDMGRLATLGNSYSSSAKARRWQSLMATS